MLRQVLALFALLSGLAAVGAPVHAAVSGNIGAVMEQSSTREADARTKKAPCPARDDKQKLRETKPAPCAKSSTVIIYVPTVMFGVDRAYE